MAGSMNGHRRITDAFGGFDRRKGDRQTRFSGLLGTIQDGNYVVHVVNRPGYMWVRLRNSTNEIIQAYNSIVSPIYDLPVLLERDQVDGTRYKVIGFDESRYEYRGF